jgi:4-hydroxy-tetrahydrodipicolinate reductase
MGKMIERLATNQGHEVVMIADQDKPISSQLDKLLACEVVIDFSTPTVVVDNIHICMDNNIPLVVGTTGWYDKLTDVEQLVNQKEGALLYAGNLSIGVNIFFKVNQYLAKMMSNYPHYQLAVKEIHHTQKLDAPSGTAVTIANDILQSYPQTIGYDLIKEGETKKSNQNNFPLIYDRIDEVVGYHAVNYTSSIDQIQISHNALNREGFAEGAILAASFLIGKKGFFNHNDLFNF